MGAAASTKLNALLGLRLKKTELPEELQGYFEYNGKKSVEEIIKELDNKYDIFLTHNWGPGPSHANHKLVSKINTFLKSKGLKPWFDEERMEGDIQNKMTQGIDNSRLVLVFITRDYIDKVRQTDNVGDNCKLEFKYAANRKTAKNMYAIVMEPGVRDTKSWDGEVGLILGTNLYFDFSSVTDANFDGLAEDLYGKIMERLQLPLERALAQIDWSERSKSYAVGGGSATGKLADERMKIAESYKLLKCIDDELSEQMKVRQRELQTAIECSNAALKTIDSDYDKLLQFIQERKVAAIKSVQLETQIINRIFIEKEKELNSKYDEVDRYQKMATRGLEDPNSEEVSEIASRLVGYTDSPEMQLAQIKTSFKIPVISISSDYKLEEFTDKNSLLFSHNLMKYIAKDSSSPTGVCYSSFDKLLYVVESGHNQVRVFDPISKAHVRTFKTFNSPRGACLSSPSPQGEQFLFVADHCNNQVVVINSKTGALIRTFGAGNLRLPWHLCLSTPSQGDQMLYVTDSSNHRVMVYNATTGAHVQVIGAGKGNADGQLLQPSGIRLGSQSPQGDQFLYVCDYGNSRVQVFNATTGNYIRTVATGLSCCWDICLSTTIHGDQFLYVAEASKNRVQVFNAITGAHVKYIDNVGGVSFQSPSSLCVISLYSQEFLVVGCQSKPVIIMIPLI